MSNVENKLSMIYDIYDISMRWLTDLCGFSGAVCVTTVEQTQHLPRSHIVTNILVCYVIYFFAAFGLTEEGHMTCQRSHDLPEVTKQLQTRWDEKHSPYAESTKYTSDINNNKVRVWLLWIDHGWIKFI